MIRGRRWALAASVLLLAACQKKADPERMKLVQRLRDARPAARIVAIQQLAPHANREETAAIVRAAADGSVEVRKAVAQALAKVDAENATDLAATMLRDPSDEVRAAAVSTLAGRGGSRALAYLANAYDAGGPLMRAAVLAAGPEVLTQAVQAETRSWNAGLEKRKHDRLDQVQTDAIRDLAVGATPDALAELQGRLVDPKPVAAAAACLGLADAGVASAVPQIIEAMKGGRPQVTQACAYSLTVLDPKNAADVIAPLLGTPESTGILLSALEGVALSATAAEKLCGIAHSSPDASTALRAAKLVGTTCTGDVPGHESWSQPEKLAVLAALGHKDADALKLARTMLASSDAAYAAAAATYLGAAGAPQDATLLTKAVASELEALEAARTDNAKKVQDVRQVATTRKESEEAVLRSILGSKYELIQKSRKQGSENVLTRLNRTNGPDVSAMFEQRPGAIAFILAGAGAAARLKGDLKPLGDALYAQQEPRLRQLEVELAEYLGEKGSPLRERLRTSSDADYQFSQLLNDLRYGRNPPMDQLLKLAKAGTEADRVELAEALAPLGTTASQALLDLAAQEEDSLPIVVKALGSIPGAEVDRVLLRRLDDLQGVGTVAAIEALTHRDNPAIDQALARAAVHPLPAVRAAALRGLATRKACNLAPALKGLSGDHVGLVRSASSALQSGCAVTVTTP